MNSTHFAPSSVMKPLLGKACWAAIDTVSMIQTGVLRVGEEVSLIMHKVYSLDGFERWTKASLSNLRFISLIPSIRSVFPQAIASLIDQRNLIYSTLSIGSLVDFIRERPVRERFIRTRKEYDIQPPEERPGKTDVVKVLYAIGNCFETAKFIQRYQIYDFPYLSQLATVWGATKVFTFRDYEYTLNDIPVVNSLFDAPKDFFVFSASLYSTYRILENYAQHPRQVPSFESLLKLTGNIGKMVLITTAQHLIRNKSFLVLSIIDVVTNNSSLIAMLIANHKAQALRDAQLLRARTANNGSHAVRVLN